MAVAFSPDGKQVVSSGFEPGLYWWNAADGRAHPDAGRPWHRGPRVGFQQGRQAASSPRARDRTVRLWDGSNGAPVKSLPVGSMVYAVAISPDGKRSSPAASTAWCGSGTRRAAGCWLTLLALPPQGARARLAGADAGGLCDRQRWYWWRWGGGGWAGKTVAGGAGLEDAAAAGPGRQGSARRDGAGAGVREIIGVRRFIAAFAPSAGCRAGKTTKLKACAMNLRTTKAYACAFFSVLLVLLVLASLGRAQTSFPMITHAHPGRRAARQDDRGHRRGPDELRRRLQGALRGDRHHRRDRRRAGCPSAGRGKPVVRRSSSR